MKSFVIILAVVCSFLFVGVKAQTCGIGSASDQYEKYFAVDDEPVTTEQPTVVLPTAVPTGQATGNSTGSPVELPTELPPTGQATGLPTELPTGSPRGKRAVRPPLRKKIIGGKIFKDGSFPWLVYLSIAHDGGQVGACTGSIVSANYILTGKHCTNFTNLESITISYGSAKRENMLTQTSNLTFSPDSKAAGSDIALVKLSTPIVFNENVGPICLSKSMRPQTGGKAVVAGFGYVPNGLINGTAVDAEVKPENINKTIPGELNAVGIDILEDRNCLCNCSDDSDKGIQISSEMCAGGEGKGTMEGDSGGPMMVLDTSAMQWFQVGITARGTNYAGNDTSVLVDHAVYTDVSKFCEWIETTTEKEVACEY